MTIFIANILLIAAFFFGMKKSLDPFASESNHLWPYLQKGDDIIIMVMLKFRQKMLAWKLSHPLHLPRSRK